MNVARKPDNVGMRSTARSWFGKCWRNYESIPNAEVNEQQLVGASASD